MHDAGFEHRDFHVGNVLVRGGDLYVLDVHRASRSRSVSKSRRVDGAVFAALSIVERVPLTEVARFFRECGVDLPEAFRRLRRRRFQLWRGRDGRATVEGSGYGVRDGVYYARGVDLDALLEKVKSGPWKVEKQKDREALSRAGDLFLKRTRKALSIWRNAHSLQLRGIAVPPHLACGKDWVAGRWIEAPNLYEYVRGRESWSRADRDDFLFRLARLVRRLHERGIFHKDLKATNVLVADRFYLVDIDRVAFGTAVSEADRIFNLAQLNAAVPGPVTRTDRLRFLRWYFGRDRARRNWIPRIMKITIARKHVWPPR
jgi:tRNA A-37 threonylcarbamoyl transferase component Bud32